MTRPTEDDLRRLAKVDTPTVANAIAHFQGPSQHMAFASAELRCAFADLPPVVGFAVTCREDTTTPRSGEGLGFAPVYRAIAASPRPSLVVCQDVGLSPLRSCHLGDVMATTMQALGTVGFVTDGAVRDLTGIRERAPGFQVFSIGSVPSAGQPSLIDVQVTVSILGMTVNPGDLLHADVNGAVVVPADIVSEILEEAERVRAYEARTIDFLTSDRFTLDAYLDRSYLNLAGG